MRKTSSKVTASSKRSTQFSSSRQRLLFALLAFSSLTSGGAAFAAGGSLPTGGHFVGGAGAITSGNTHLSISQSTQTGIINWQSFSIGKGDSVSIANGKGATLNRVTGGDISTIAGSLKGTGSIYVVNQAGVVVGPGGKVVTGGSFVASTRDVSNATFMAGGNIDLSGSSSGTVVNQGSITANNGNVVLVGKSVSNSGSISAAKGNASLVAGDNVLLQASGDDAVLVETASGNVTNTGTVAAAQVALNAAGGNVYALAVNDGGVIRATGTATRDGHVYLTAGDDLKVSGSVSATNADGSGGTIVATASAVTIGGKARISADGTTDGGTILIGGDRHGGTDRSVALSKTPVANAKTTTVMANARISASGHGKGDGGNIVVWSNDTTTYAGRISAQGGWNRGNGGFVEVSGKTGLAFTGRVNTMAPHGKSGTLLLDPSDVTIVSSTDPGANTTTSGQSQSGGTFDPTTGTSFILNTDIDAALASNNVVINTGSLGDALGGTGNISIGTNNGAAFLHSAPIHWSTSNSLTLNAVGIITSPGGNPNGTTGGFSPDHPSVLIDSEGGGAIFFNAGGNGQTTGSAAISLQGNIQGSGGLVSLVTTNAGYRIEFNNGQGITNTAQFGAGQVILQADQVHLGTSTGPSGFVTTPGEVDIVPTATTAVVVGDNNPTGDYSATANTALIRSEDVVNITANLLVIGSTHTPSLDFETVNPTADAALSGFTQFAAISVKNLKLLTSTTGTVSQDANTAIIVNDPGFDFTTGPNSGTGGLAVQAGAAITLNNAANSVGSIAFKQTGTGGDIAFASAASTDTNFTVGTVADISGITTVGARTVTLAIAGDTVTQSSGAANAIAPTSGSIALDLEGADSSFALDNPANAIKTVAATVESLSLHSNIALSTATIGTSAGITATEDVTVVDNGLLTIGAGAGIATTGGSVKLEDQTFTNSDAGAAFTVGAGGTWRVYSQDPTLDSDNGETLAYSFVQYNAANSYATPFATANGVLTASGATGNGFIYAVAPVLKETVADHFTKTYDGNTTVTGTIVAGDYTVTTGGINGDQITFTNPTGTGAGVATYADKNAATGIDISLTNPVTFAAKDANNVQIFGYGLTVTNNLKGDITPLGLTVTGTRAYNGTTGASSTILTASGEVVGDPTLTVTGSGTLASKNASTTATNISALGTLGLSGTGSGNYTIASGTVVVTPLDVTVTGTRVYDGMTDASGTILSVVGEIGGDPALTVTGSGTLASKNASTTATNISALGTLGLSGTGNGNYHISSGTVTVTPLGLTVTGTRVYDGTTGASSTILTASGEIGGDPALTVTGSGTLASKNASTTPTNISGLSGLGLSGTGSGNYTIASGTVTVTPLDVTVTGTRAYDGTTGASGTILTVSGEIGGDPALTVTGSGTLASKNASTTATNISALGTLGLSGTGNGNYHISSGTVTVTPLGLTVTGTRVYDGTTGASSTILTASGVIGGDPALTVTGSGTLASKNASSTPTNISALGTLGLSGTGSGNYSIASGTVTVTPLDLTVTGTRAYNGGTGASGTILTVSGEIGGDPALTVTGSGTLASKNASTTPTNISALGTLGLSGAGNGNYHISSGTVTVTPLDVTVTGTRVYDGTTLVSSPILSVVGEIGGDPALTVTGSGTLASKNASSTPTNISNMGSLALSGTGNGNYHIVSGTVTVTPLGLTVTGTRAYNGGTGASGTILTVSGEIGGDPALTVTGSGTLASKNASSTPTNISVLSGLGLSGSGSGNYTIASGTVTVTPLDVTVTGTRAYDGTTGASGTILSVDGEISGDGLLNVIGNGTLASKNANTTPTNISSLGTLDLTGTNAGNYNIVSGKVTVTPKIVTVTGTRGYDGMTDASGTILTVNGVIGGDPALTVTGSGTLANKNASNTPTNISVLTGLGLSGTGNGNYKIGSGKVKVTPIDLVITPDAFTRVYDGSTTNKATYSDMAGNYTFVGLQGSESVGSSGDALFLTGSMLFGGSNGTVVRNAGTYSQGAGTLALGGSGAGNYVLTFRNPHPNNYVITPADLTIVGFNGTRVYDGMTDANSSILTLTGLTDGDRVTLTGSGVLASKNVGKETVTGVGTLALGGADGGNYQIVVGRPDTYVIVTKATLTVDAVTQTKVFDGTTVSTRTPTVAGLKTGDSITGALDQAYDSRNVLGTNGSTLAAKHDIGVDDGNGGGNYTIVYKTAKGTITPENITISALTQTKVYDGTTKSTKTPTMTAGMLYNGDTLTGLSQLYKSKNVLGPDGSTLTVGSYTLTDARNYHVIVKTAKGTITPLTVDITGTRVYNGTPGVDGDILTVTGMVPGDDIGVTGTGTSSSPHVGTHKITGGDLTLTGGDSGNYTLTGGDETVKITPYAVILTGTRVYDGDTDGDAGILSVTNAFHGDTVTVDTGTSTIVSRNVGNEKIVNFGTLTLGGASSGDYTLVGAKGNVIVTPEMLVVTAVPTTKPQDGTTTSPRTPIVTEGTIFGSDTGGFIQTYGNPDPGKGLTLTPSGSVNDGNGGNNYIVTFVPVTTGVITDTAPPDMPFQIPNTQTASGNGTSDNFVVSDSGIISLTPRQNGVVTGTIATIDGTDYHPDSQLGCTLGADGCIQNGVAPTTTSAPPQ